jgi:hypothetical protein
MDIKRLTLKMLRSLKSFVRWFILLPLLFLAMLIFIPILLGIAFIFDLINPYFSNDEDPGGY